jgi:hypothetical protein
MRTIPTTRETARSDRMLSSSTQAVNRLIIPDLEPSRMSRTFALHDRIMRTDEVSVVGRDKDNAEGGI